MLGHMVNKFEKKVEVLGCDLIYGTKRMVENHIPPSR